MILIKGGLLMKPLYCQYCGESLDEHCNCAREIAEAKEQFLEDYYNSPETQLGWAQQDLIDMHRFEK